MASHAKESALRFVGFEECIAVDFAFDENYEYAVSGQCEGKGLPRGYEVDRTQQRDE